MTVFSKQIAKNYTEAQIVGFVIRIQRTARRELSCSTSCSRDSGCSRRWAFKELFSLPVKTVRVPISAPLHHVKMKCAVILKRVSVDEVPLSFEWQATSEPCCVCLCVVP